MVWIQDKEWKKLTEPKSCRHIGGSPRTHCPNMADFGVPRSNVVWAYCEEHMYGRRIRDGIVETEVHPDSPAAKRGYVPGDIAGGTHSSPSAQNLGPSRRIPDP